MKENEQEGQLRTFNGEPSSGIKTLQGIGAAESYLAQEEDDGLEEQLQALIEEKGEDHPMVKEMREILTGLGGDLGKLPAGHPILMQIMDAKHKYEEMVEAEEAQDEAIKVKKAKRIDTAKKLAEHRRKEEEDSSRRKAVAKKFNEKIDNAITSLEVLAHELMASKEKLETDPYMRVRVQKLTRLLGPVNRGLEECKIGLNKV